MNMFNKILNFGKVSLYLHKMLSVNIYVSYLKS